MIDIILFSIIEKYAKSSGIPPENLGISLENVNGGNIVCAYDLEKFSVIQMATTFEDLAQKASSSSLFLRKSDDIIVVFNRIVDNGPIIMQVHISSMWFEDVGQNQNITEHSSIITI